MIKLPRMKMMLMMMMLILMMVMMMMMMMMTTKLVPTMMTRKLMPTMLIMMVTAHPLWSKQGGSEPLAHKLSKCLNIAQSKILTRSMLVKES